VVVPAILGTPGIVYPVLYFAVLISVRILAGNTFSWLDLSQVPITFELSEAGIVTSKPGDLTGKCGCCPLPMPGLYKPTERVARSSITELHVYKQTIYGVTHEVSNAQGGSTEVTYRVDESSIQPVLSPGTPVNGRPDVMNLFCQPCDMVAVQGGCSKGGSFTQLFLGVKSNRKLVRLSRAAFTRCLAAELFMVRDQLRAHFPALQHAPH